jgi:DMSO/TMAO reductase YedYZ molybdopterin-dependent catalytic subunit
MIKKPNFGTGILISALLTAPLIALMYLGDRLFGLSFAPFDLFNWIARVLPGPVITFGIDLMIDTMRLLGIDVADAAKTAEQLMAVITFFLIGTAIGTLFVLVTNRQEKPPGLAQGLIVAALFGLPMIAISVGEGDSTLNPWINILWSALLFAAWGLILGWSDRKLWVQVPGVVEQPADEEGQAEPQVQRLSRRQFLLTLGASSAAITVIGTGLAAVLDSTLGGLGTAGGSSDDTHSTDETANIQLPNQNDPVMPAPGTRPEYTPLKDHYKVFIELEPTEIEGSSWHLPITGMVANPLMLTLDDLRQNYPALDQYITISCISGRIGTSLIGTTQWTGASVQDVLADAQVQSGARYLHIGSGDGFYETVDLDLINSDARIMFCYAWDGNPLPVDHGFPLRIWIPDRFGMKQPKWITSVEVTDTYKEGYWVERGWDEVAQVKTTSVIDTVAVDAAYEGADGRLVPVGGIAFSGDRGISKVEVSVDGGPWQQAMLRSPLSETTWVIWRYDWPFQPGDHTFEVRCYQGDGTLQIVEQSDARPSGSTGIHSVEESLPG